MKTISKERRTLLAKRLDLDACKTKVRKAQSPEKIQQVSMHNTCGSKSNTVT